MEIECIGEGHGLRRIGQGFELSWARRRLPLLLGLTRESSPEKMVAP